MKILVTGANGYLGQGIVRQLLDFGHEVIAVDFATDNIDSRATAISCNLFEVEEPYDFFGKPGVLLHLAWRDGFVHYSDAHIMDLPKHYQFLCKMVQNTGIKRVAVMGSMHEIGFFEGSINENTPCHPITPYGIGKNALRDLTKMIVAKNNAAGNSKIEFQWLRGYYIVGNTQYGSSVFSKITAAQLEGKKMFPFTMGQNQYDFIDYDEFCFQVAASVCQEEVNGIINICSGKPEKLADRVERFIKENGYDIQLEYGAFPDRAYDSKAIWGDSTKIETIVKNLKNKV